MKILIRGVNWIGDAVMTTPAIRGVRLLYPNATIYLLVNPLVAQLYQADPAIDEIMLYDKGGEHKGIFGFLKLTAQIRALKFDMAILLQNAIEAAIIAFMGRIPVRIGYDTESRFFLLTQPIKRSQEILKKHQVFYYINILNNIEKRELPYYPSLIVRESEVKAIKKKYPEISEGNIIGINPGSTYGSAKRWSAKKFAEVADALTVRYNAKILLFGGPAEAEISQQVCDEMKEEALMLGGKTNIRELMTLIKLCKLFITNDTGPMHIASAFNIPTVAIFGSTDTKTTSPFGNFNLIVKKEIECAPCLLRECPKDHECMNAITANEVIDAAQSLIKR